MAPAGKAAPALKPSPFLGRNDCAQLSLKTHDNDYHSASSAMPVTFVQERGTCQEQNRPRLRGCDRPTAHDGSRRTDGWVFVGGLRRAININFLLSYFFAALAPRKRGRTRTISHTTAIMHSRTGIACDRVYAYRIGWHCDRCRISQPCGSVASSI